MMTRTPTLTASIHLQDDFTLLTDILPANGAACIEVGGKLNLFVYDPEFALKLAAALTDVAAKMRVSPLADEAVTA